MDRWLPAFVLAIGAAGAAVVPASAPVMREVNVIVTTCTRSFLGPLCVETVEQMVLPLKSNALLCRKNSNLTPMPEVDIYWCILVDKDDRVTYEQFVFGVEREA